MRWRSRLWAGASSATFAWSSIDISGHARRGRSRSSAARSSVMRIAVVGGGISGLVAAYRLKAAGRGLDVQLLEAAPRAGGHAWTTRQDGFVIEAGPNAVVERAGEPELQDLARELQIESRLREARPTAKRRFILRRGRLHRAPDSPPTLLTTSL